VNSTVIWIKLPITLRSEESQMPGTEMQLSMTSINNLAVMLDDHYDMMMNMMANAMPAKGKKKGKQQAAYPWPNLQQHNSKELSNSRTGVSRGDSIPRSWQRWLPEQERIKKGSSGIAGQTEK